jgi:hypothetical protein
MQIYPAGRVKPFWRPVWMVGDTLHQPLRPIRMAPAAGTGSVQWAESL